MNGSRFSMLVLGAVLALPVLADVTDEAIKLTQSGVTENVIVAWCERQSVSDFTAEDVVRLRDGKVPERAIAAILRTAAHQTVPINPNNTEYVAPATTPVDSSSYDYPYFPSYGHPYYRSFGSEQPGL